MLLDPEKIKRLYVENTDSLTDLEPMVFSLSDYSDTLRLERCVIHSMEERLTSGVPFALVLSDVTFGVLGHICDNSSTETTPG